MNAKNIKELNVYYISDTHLDDNIKETNDSVKLQDKISKFVNNLHIDIEKSANNVIVVAGDIGHYFVQNKYFLLKMKELFDNVIYVPGNHDYYLISNSQQEKYSYDSYNKIIELKEFCLKNNIHFLDGEYIELFGFKIAGAMSYWDSTYYKTLKPNSHEYEVNEFYERRMNTMNFIMFGKKPYKIPLAYGEYLLKSSFSIKSFREEQIAKLQNICDSEYKIDLMISHYPPIIDLNFKEEDIDDEINTFYSFDGSKYQTIIKPKIWIFGHYHHKQNIINNGTNYLSNPIGYLSDKLNAKIEKVVLK